MHGIAKSLLGLWSAAIVVAGLATEVQAGLTVCNETEQLQSVAIGYEAPGGVWTSEGWWHVDAGDCKLVMARALGRRDFYYRATVAGGGFDGPFAFCTTTDAFTIAGDEDCESRGYERTRFRKVDTGEVADFTLTLVAEGPAPAPRQGADAGKSHSSRPLEVSFPVPRGTLGEPFAQWGVFYGCHTIDGLDYCRFEVEGWRYDAYYGGGTADALLDALQGWPLPLGVELEGDMITYGDITVEVALGRVTEVPGSDAFAAERAALQGTWRSIEDPRSEFRVVGGDVYDYYDGEFIAEQWMTISETCPDAPTDGIGITRMELGTDDYWCVLLGHFGPDFIEFINPGRGNILTYQRID
ncbi:DUF1036 domain-containing protein [Maliponia aquimaris]|uniref:Integral membrane protein n=1 Tax=Maliponia aquimaris TaxID=1673631 RepID=A0A238KLN0_9RHOB|nr:DUF1036 domain-containing protein [Maliponia aquimaris]SMX43668.1 hypothetical protein MAA8898_02881 [Maliponia aquimaris]